MKNKPVYEIKRLIETHFEHNDKAFIAICNTIIDTYSKDGDIQGANELKEILKKYK